MDHFLVCSVFAPNWIVGLQTLVTQVGGGGTRGVYSSSKIYHEKMCTLDIFHVYWLYHWSRYWIIVKYYGRSSFRKIVRLAAPEGLTSPFWEILCPSLNNDNNYLRQNLKAAEVGVIYLLSLREKMCWNMRNHERHDVINNQSYWWDVYLTDSGYPGNGYQGNTVSNRSE